MPHHADVFDTPRWKECVGDLEEGEACIVLLFCIDAIQAFKKFGLSVMPAEFLCLSLPPWLRYKAANMLISMLMPSTLSAKAQKKYFDYVIVSDLNVMLREGVQGPNGKIKFGIYGYVRAWR